MEQDMSTTLATKSDLGATQLLLKQEIDANRALLEHKLELLRSSMTIRLGSMQIVGMGLLFAALKLT